MGSSRQKKKEHKKKAGSRAPKAASSEPAAGEQKKPQVSPQTPQQKIDSFRESYEKYSEMVKSFTESHKENVYLEGMLDKLILKLDGVDDEEVRIDRKKLITDIQSSISQLEEKNPAKANVKQQGSQSVSFRKKLIQ